MLKILVLRSLRQEDCCEIKARKEGGMGQEEGGRARGRGEERKEGEKERERDARSQKKGRKEETVTVRGRLCAMF